MPGRYRIFLGMAAGVGKTYRMLGEAQAEAEAGRDVVVGLLETHGRAATADAAVGLEPVPRRRGTVSSPTAASAVAARPCVSSSPTTTSRPASASAWASPSIR